ncbi:MAG: hypothetical protein OK442_03965 [Thaumarchaeota archaeon]|nr:hypothetical protein [Nitrososphaerota archaeon]
MGEEVGGREGEESSNELDELRKELLEGDREKEELPGPDDAQRGKGERAETSGSELDQLRDELARRHPSEEEPA